MIQYNTIYKNGKKKKKKIRYTIYVLIIMMDHTD